MTQTLRVEWIGPSGNVWQRWNNFKQNAYSKKMYPTIGWEIKAQRLQPFPEDAYPVRLTLVCYFTSASAAYDWTNLYPTAKIAEDAIRKAGIIIDDNRNRVAYGTMIPMIDTEAKNPYSIITLSTTKKL